MRTVFFLLLCSLCSCSKIDSSLDFSYPHQIVSLPKESFAKSLSPKEQKTDWGKEYFLARSFAKEGDLYRALGSYKRSTFLIPPGEKQRAFELEYAALLTHYLAAKYDFCIYPSETFIPHLETFPACEDALLILYDSSRRMGKLDQARFVGQLLHHKNPTSYRKVLQYHALERGDLSTFPHLSKLYRANKLSVRKARYLNALLPGAGYAYIGQKSTALTAFVLNGLFILATKELFDKGQKAAAIFCATVEAGWYFGGIHGAGLAAQQHNQRIYRDFARKEVDQRALHPLLMLKYGF